MMLNTKKWPAANGGKQRKIRSSLATKAQGSKRFPTSFLPLYHFARVSIGTVTKKFSENSPNLEEREFIKSFEETKVTDGGFSRSKVTTGQV